VAIVAAMLIVFANSPSCDEAATTAQRNDGVLALILGAVVLAGAWGVVAARHRARWRRLALGGAIGPLLLLLIALSHLTTRSWVGDGICF